MTFTPSLGDVKELVAPKPEAIVASYGANLVRIIVGPEKVLSIVHVEALTTVSGWFSEKLSKDFDFQNDPIRLLGGNPQVFNSFLKWVYAKYGDTLCDSRFDNVTQSDLLNLYDLAYSFQVHQLSDALVSVVYKRMWSYFEPISHEPVIMNWLTLAFDDELLKLVVQHVSGGLFRLIARGLAFEMLQQVGPGFNDTELGNVQRQARSDRVKNIPDVLLRVIVVEYFRISPLEVENGFQHCVGEEKEYLHSHSDTPSSG